MAAEPVRAHARHNRERILAVAHAALTESSTASLNSIARRAGVGIGTVYRHFPTREDLVLAVYQREVQQLVDTTPVLLAQRPPLAALRAWLDGLAHYGMTKYGLADALSAAAPGSLTSIAYEPLVGALTALLAANHAAGTIRSDISAHDLLVMLSFLWRIDPGSDWQAQSARMLDVLVDGLRVPPV